VPRSPEWTVRRSRRTRSRSLTSGCNNVTPTINNDGTATYTFTPQTIADAGGQVAFPTGTITSIDVLIDVRGPPT
jgi:hypothetical protein